MTTQKTLWIWHRTQVATLVQLAERYDLTRLLVWVSPGFTANQTTITWLQRLGAAAKANGLLLDALCGDPGWAQQPNLAGIWAAEVRRSNRFQRLHLDIEPHALAQWETDSSNLVAGLVTAVEAAAAASGLPVDVDLPTWYYRIPTLDGLSADIAVLRAADSITLMAYQNTADKILATAGQQMANAANAGKSAHIGVNLAEPVNDAPTSSLWGQPPDAQRDVMTRVASEAATFPAYAGLAIHDAASLAQL